MSTKINTALRPFNVPNYVLVVEQEHPYFIHAKTCKQCGPSGFCAEGARLYNTASTPSARAAAEEIHRLCDELAPDIPNDSTSYAPSVEQIEAIISRHCSPVTEGEGDQKDGWVTFGRVKVDIENETETFERIKPE